MKFMITSVNKKLGIDNNKATFSEIENKLTEEYREVIKELESRTLSGSKEFNSALTGEVFDLIQVLIVLLEKLKNEGVDISNLNVKHNQKLLGREWENNGHVYVKFNRNFAKGDK